MAETKATTKVAAQTAQWVFEGYFDDEVTFNQKKIKMRSLTSEEHVEASRAAKLGSLGDEYDRDFLMQLETLAIAIIEIEGCPVEREAMREWLKKSPEVIVKVLYTQYLITIVKPIQELIKQVKNS